jgi:hypothetical protein
MEGIGDEVWEFGIQTRGCWWVLETGEEMSNELSLRFTMMGQICDYNCTTWFNSLKKKQH